MFARKSTRTFLWLLACITCIAGSAPAARGQEAQADVLPLEQAVAMALGENRQVKSASIEVEKFSDKLAALRATFLADVQPMLPEPPLKNLSMSVLGGGAAVAVAVMATTEIVSAAATSASLLTLETSFITYCLLWACWQSL